VTRQVVALVALVMALSAGAASAADDALARATRLYERHQYEDAARGLREALPALSPAARPTAWLTLGAIYLGNAELHRELYRTALVVQLDYLKRLAAVRGAAGSRFVGLYLGRVLLENGDAREAAKHLERFSAQPGLDPRSRAIAGASLGLSLFLTRNQQAARARWASVDTADPEAQLALAAVYSRAGLKDRDPVGLGDAALKKAGSPSSRMLESLLTVYARAGLTDKSLELVRHADLRTASYTEAVDQTKTISFYDVAALGDLATIYGRASVAYLERAATDAQLKPFADYYLGAAYAEAGEMELSLRATAAFLSSSSVPPPQRNRARARQAAAQYQQGRRAEAMAVWDSLAREPGADPELLAEILLGCARARADCAGIAETATRAAEAGEGRKTRALNAALGRLQFRKGDYARAVQFLEMSRDKSKKNRIESNDPLMLVNLAEAYYRTRQFSEGLEIYFEMSKHFPVVRRIQEAMQGMYAMEHKSAGDVRIF
jgi:tetratricopeptide (TPR) repeat protein